MVTPDKFDSSHDLALVFRETLALLLHIIFNLK